MSLKIEVATSNTHKLARFREILAPLGWHLLGRAVGPWTAEVTPHGILQTLSEEALQMARQSSLPVLADQSFFAAIDQGFPELLWVHLDTHQSQAPGLKLYEQGFKNSPLERRRASFLTHMVLAFPDGHLERYSGQTDGIMLDGPRGGGGSGYDPRFLLLETGQTFAEMSPDEQRHFSPWERALRKLLKKHLLLRLASEYPGDPTQGSAASSPLNQASRKKVLLATSNPGKVGELEQALSPTGWELLSLLDFKIQLPPETGLTFEDNALLKAAFACQNSGLVALADDSGLEVDALDGEPGVRSARFGGKNSDTERNVYLLERLRGVPAEKRSARFVSAIAIAHPDGQIEMYRGETRGRVLEAPRGSGGFGYDPLFLVEETGQTFAEMSLLEKQRFSHRGKAIAALLAANKAKV